LHEIGPALDPLGQALINQPDIDDQALGGAIATSTHGTGRDLGSLSSYVVGLTLATPNGELIECDAEQNAEIFHAARCSIGSLGVVTRVRLQNRAPYRLNESTRLLPISELLAEAEELRDAHRHMELMALPHSGLGLLVVTNEETGDVVDVHEDPSAVNGLREAWGAVGESPTIYRQALLQVLGTEADHRMGPSHRVLAHDRYVRFREMEYTLPAEAGPACLSEILETIEREEIPVVFPIEYRYVAADDVWLSMFNDRAGCSISMHQYADEDARPIFDAIEPIFWRYGGRPHWGKLHSLGADRLAELYPHWQDFTAVRNRLDPKGKMLNEHLRSVFGVASA
jgi:FAD-linked oxidoreductase